MIPSEGIGQGLIQSGAAAGQAGKTLELGVITYYGRQVSLAGVMVSMTFSSSFFGLQGSIRFLCRGRHGRQIQTHFLAQNHSFDLGNEDAEEEDRRIVQRL